MLKSRDYLNWTFMKSTKSPKKLTGTANLGKNKKLGNVVVLYLVEVSKKPRRTLTTHVSVRRVSNESHTKMTH